jgi:hypothetical protein
MKLFTRPGEENTEKTLQLAFAKAQDLAVEEVVLPSSTGTTAHKALSMLDNDRLRLIVVTYHCGFHQPFTSSMSQKTRQELTQAGVHVLQASHILSGIDRSFRNQFGGIYPAEMVAQTLRVFGHGVKVCIEVTVMASDAGMLSGKEMVALGGTGHGVDTACVIQPAHMNNFFDLFVKEIICKPQQKAP